MRKRSRGKDDVARKKEVQKNEEKQVLKQNLTGTERETSDFCPD